MTKDQQPKPLTARQRAAGLAAAAATATASEADVRPTNKAGGTVTVGCKVALAWIDLQLCELQEKYENTQSGPRLVKESVRVGGIVRIRGTAFPRGEKPDGFPERPEMASGAALTHGVSADFWGRWVKQNERSPMVISGMIFAHAKAEDARARAKEFAGQLSGLEPVNRYKRGREEVLDDPRVGRSINAGVTSVAADGDRLSTRSAAGS